MTTPNIQPEFVQPARIQFTATAASVRPTPSLDAHQSNQTELAAADLVELIPEW